MPVDEPIEAMPLLPLAHVPPLEKSASVVVNPTHTWVVPNMTAGSGFTVTVVALVHPAPMA